MIDPHKILQAFKSVGSSAEGHKEPFRIIVLRTFFFIFFVSYMVLRVHFKNIDEIVSPFFVLPIYILTWVTVYYLAGGGRK